MKDTELAYLAGFIDGEGTIGIVSVASHKRYVVQIAACNCNPIPIELLENNFGGKVRLRKWKNENWKPCYEWKLTARKAVAVIKSILPYLLIKGRQAEIAIEAQAFKDLHNAAQIRWNPVLKQERTKKLIQLKEECALLNHRGIK